MTARPASTTLALEDLPCFQGSAAIEGTGQRAFLLSPVSPAILRTLYDLLQADGLMELLFFEYAPDVERFAAWLESGDVRYAVTMVASPTLDSAEIAGIGIVWNLTELSSGAVIGECGMAFRRKFQGGDLPVILTRLMLRFAFEPLGIELLAGVTPVVNRPAMRFIERVGFQRSHLVPGFRRVGGRPCSCWISFLTRDNWRLQPA